MSKRSTSPTRGSDSGSALHRYLALDLAGWVGCLGLGSAVHQATGRYDAMVVGAILGENLAFYGLALLMDGWRARSRPGALLRALGGLLAEFAPAELLDTLAVRPVSMLVAGAAFDSPLLGLVLGGIGADVVYYGVAMRCRAWAQIGRVETEREAGEKSGGLGRAT